MLSRRLFSTTSAVAENYYKITLKRSTIGTPRDFRAATKTLGLFRLHQTTYRPVNATNAGLILKLKELVNVEIVDRIPDKAELAAKKPPKGYTVVGNKLQ